MKYNPLAVDLENQTDKGTHIFLEEIDDTQNYIDYLLANLKLALLTKYYSKNELF